MFPLVALEALSHGARVIARHLGGLPEIAKRSGAQTYEGDDELVAVMDELLKHPELREQIGRRGQDAVKEHWSTEAHLERYFAIIEDFRSRGRGSV